MDNKGISKIFIVVIIVAVLTVSAIAVFLLMSGNGGNDGTNDNGGGTSVDVAGASSLQFKVRVDLADEDDIEYSYAVKNAETDDLMLRIEMRSGGEEFIYIVNGAQENVWVYSNGDWMDLSQMFPTYWETWSSAWEGYRANLLDWTGTGDWAYSVNGESIRIYDIAVNPTLPDSMFEH